MEKLKFITIEGGDGAGKSTFIKVIKDYLESMGQEVVLTREPGGTQMGERLRDMLLTHPMDVTAETLLLFAARSQHHTEIINPALESGKWVLCDRYTDSTFAYQCAAKGFQEGHLKHLEQIVQNGIKPGITFIFDVPLNVAKQRLAKTGKIPDKFESEDDDFKLRVNSGYKNLAKRDPSRCKLIDSSQTIEDTKKQVLEELEPFIREVLANNSNKKKLNIR